MPPKVASASAAKGKKGKGNKKPSSAMVAQQSSQGRASIPQTCKLNIDQVLNCSGGYVWKLSPIEHVNRYLVLGGAKDMGNYYKQADDVSHECALSVLQMIRNPDASQFVQLCDLLKAVSIGGRAPKQEPVLLSVAAAIVFAKNAKEKEIAFETAKACIRIPTHMFMLAGFVRDLSMAKTVNKGKGWGTGFRRTMAHYYLSHTGRELAFHMTKYQNREGWTHADMIRMLHINPTTLADDGARLMFDYVMMKYARKSKTPSEKTLATLALQKIAIEPSPFKPLTRAEFVEKLNAISTPQIPTAASIAAARPAIAPPAPAQKSGAQTVASKVAGFVSALTSVMPSSASAAKPADAAVKPAEDDTFVVISGEDDDEAGSSQKKKASSAQSQLQQVAFLLKHLHAIHEAGEKKDVPLACALIRSGRLVREHVPTTLFGSKEIWLTLLETMPLEALLRNLGKLTQIGVAAEKHKEIVVRLTNQQEVLKARIHPIKVLVASKVYTNGCGDSGSLTWTPNAYIGVALTDLFRMSYGAVTPTGKRIMLGIDVSGSMSSSVLGSKVLTCRDASIAMALLYLETETNVSAVAFSNTLTDLLAPSSRNRLTRGMTLQQALVATHGMNFSSTDCVLPIQHAIKHNLLIDAFIILTDNETYAPNEHPQNALIRYRELTGIQAKLIVLGMTGNCFTIVDPTDRNTLNLAGFDTSTPEIASMFMRGEI
jgi:TROVE domain